MNKYPRSQITTLNFSVFSTRAIHIPSSSSSKRVIVLLTAITARHFLSDWQSPTQHKPYQVSIPLSRGSFSREPNLRTLTLALLHFSGSSGPGRINISSIRFGLDHISVPN